MPQETANKVLRITVKQILVAQNLQTITLLAGDVTIANTLLFYFYTDCLYIIGEIEYKRT